NLASAPVYVHRDFMPRNLMITPEGPALLDFQDAVRGPIVYDPASMLRDAFVSWDEEREIDWAVRWWQSARAAGLPVPADFGELWRSFEWMGMQRHLKVLGIFCRLKHRDGKPAYSADIPRVLASVVTVARRYDAFSGLLRLIERSGDAAAAARAGS
ncbi:MAG: aminoglycoside phosphotransferase family protein, partial [Gammaproteobacteria bacterium]